MLLVFRCIPNGSVDMICCDLPYGVINRNNKNAQWDNIIPFEPLWRQYLRVIKPNGAIVLFSQGMFTAQLMISQPRLWRYNLVWDKVNRPTGFLNSSRMPLRIHEDICVFYKEQPTYNPQFVKGNIVHKRGAAGNVTNGCYDNFRKTKAVLTNEKHPTSIVSIDKEHDGVYLHPTQKPVKLIAWLIKTYTNEGDVVLDNCIGSGTTAIACIRTNRRYIGFEITKEYYDVAQRRIDAEKKQLTLPFI